MAYYGEVKDRKQNILGELTSQLGRNYCLPMQILRMR